MNISIISTLIYTIRLSFSSFQQGTKPMNQYFIKPRYILLFVVLSIVSCSESIDLSKLSPIQQALYNPQRTDYERSIDGLRKSGQLLEIVNIKPGMKIADIDAGNGYYTELFSSLVGITGQVYFQNAQRFVVNHPDTIEKRLKNNRLPNVTRIDSSFNELKLPNDLDLIFISKAFHDIFVPQQKVKWNAETTKYYPQIVQALKPGGRLIIIDHASKEGRGTKDAATLHRIDEKFTVKKFIEAGLTLTSTNNLYRNPKDDHSLLIWDKSVYRKTDRFILIFTKK